MTRHNPRTSALARVRCYTVHCGNRIVLPCICISTCLGFLERLERPRENESALNCSNPMVWIKDTLLVSGNVFKDPGLLRPESLIRCMAVGDVVFLRFQIKKTTSVRVVAYFNFGTS